MPGLSKLIGEELGGTKINSHAAMSPENTIVPTEQNSNNLFSEDQHNDHTQVSFSAITKIQGAPGRKAPRLALLEGIQPCALDPTQQNQIQLNLNLPQQLVLILVQITLAFSSYTSILMVE
ncbi:hypothetical protein POM88_019202 [Heracleum sosnowskyi]|uniref:Uncharacterized protein n=1 Tax=Heracleum sosnowskyi TaxID=360622 RepID=A0AAD8MZM1_9APIA|nr:hypothetical protein POM88_019202 [Heracleum sosnowskyi]